MQRRINAAQDGVTVQQFGSCNGRRSHPPARPLQVWTSLKALDGREFCSMLNALIRDDAQLTDEVADQVGADAR
jgi:hypothetical protein